MFESRCKRNPYDCVYVFEDADFEKSDANAGFRSNGPDTDRTRTGPFLGSYLSDRSNSCPSPVRGLSVFGPGPVRVRSVRFEPGITLADVDRHWKQNVIAVNWTLQLYLMLYGRQTDFSGYT
jgi:hypothetical protein